MPSRMLACAVREPKWMCARARDVPPGCARQPADHQKARRNRLKGLAIQWSRAEQVRRSPVGSKSASAGGPGTTEGIQNAMEHAVAGRDVVGPRRSLPVRPDFQHVAQGPNTDQRIALATRSIASEPRCELPLALRPGDQTASEATPGTIARMPPPTPLLPGMPTR